jgi:Recombination endonuclease VII
VNAVIDDLQATATTPDWPRIAPRDDTSAPPRSAYHRGEVELASRLGHDEIPRHTLERLIRQAAVESMSEADFIRLAHESGVRLIPRIGSADPGVIAYSALLASLPSEHQREFGGQKLARDLTLDHLRGTWGSPGALTAWATWRKHTGVAPTQVQPERRGDGRWRWIHPDADHTIQLVESPSSMPKTPHARRQTARKILLAAQGGVCAMCSISYYNWRARGTGPCPILGPPEHLDHDHHTGLIRGLLCIRCNISREPGGALLRSDTWRVYTNHSPAAELECDWPWF